MAAALILGETYRGKRSRANVRDKFEEKIEELHHQVEELKAAIPPGQQLSLPGREPPSNAGSSESQALYSLTESVQLLWKLAERHGWVDNKAFVQEMHWALDEEDKEAEQDKVNQTAHEPRPAATLPTPDKTPASANPPTTPSPSPSAEELGRRRAQAIIDEIRQQTSPTPIQLPRLPTSSTSSMSSWFSWLPVVHDPRSYLQWTSAPAFEALSPFS